MEQEDAEYLELLNRTSHGRRPQGCGNIKGFLASQAVEKALEVALVLADSELSCMQDLELLPSGPGEAGIKVPDEFSGADWLTPWTAELRYDDSVALDRDAALALAQSAVDWAASLLAEASSGVTVDDSLCGPLGTMAACASFRPVGVQRQRAAAARGDTPAR